jgi:molecular chaperone DnaJ
VGEKIEKPCHECRGRGRVEKTRKLNLNIPAGVDTDSRLKMTGEGEAGEANGPRGDLFVRIHVKPHPFLERRGEDLFSEVLIPFSIAVLGGEVSIPTLDGKVKLKVPAGTPSGKVFHMKDKGMPSLHGRGRGSQFIRIEIEVPTKLSEKERHALMEWAKERKETDATPKTKNLFDHFKDSF